MKCPWLIKTTEMQNSVITKTIKQEMCDCVGVECPFYKYRHDYTVKPTKEIPYCSRAEK